MRISADPVLKVHDLSSAYGQSRVLREVSFEVSAGEALAILGSNGMGKTTLMNTVAGVLRPTSGHIMLEGQQVGGQRADLIAQSGISLVPEGRALFPDMSVEDNIRIGSWAGRARYSGDTLDEVYEHLPLFAERRRVRAGNLSGGQQQLLAVGRALMARPKVLLLDEPSLGLAPRAVRELFAWLEELVDRGLAVVVAEQDAPAAMQLAPRALVLRGGRIVKAATADELSDNEALRTLYL